MGDLQKFLKSLERPKKNNVAFGCGSPRKTFPDEKVGAKLSLVHYKSKGKSTVGPGTYNVEDKVNMVKESGKKIANVHGYLHRTQPRFKVAEIATHELEYVERQRFTRCAKPFNGGNPRFKEVLKSITNVPGPGTYSGTILPKEKSRRISSFGGKIETIPPVAIKCVSTYEDRCEQCKKAPIGVYYQNKDEILCRKCFAKLVSYCQKQGTMKRSARCDAFKKVRDCSFCHDHQGAAAAVWTKPVSLLHRQQVLETYFNRYFC